MIGSGRGTLRRGVLPAAILAIAVALRVAALWQAPPLNIDECRYLVAAHHLRSGDGYSDWRGPEIDIHPLHPVLVAALGDDPTTLETRGRAVSFFASLLLLCPLAMLACRLGGTEATLLFLLLAGTHPWLARAAAAAQPESLYVTAVATGMVALWPPDGRSTTLARWTTAGVLFGFAYLARPEGILIGLLAGGLVLRLSGGRGSRRLAGFAVLVTALLLVCAPFLIFLERHTGGWTLTGKTAELFFVGRTYAAAGETAPAADAYLDLIRQWGGVLPFVVSHPGAVLAWAGRNAFRMATWVLPRALGPAGLLGLAALAVLFPRGEKGTILGTALLLIPCLSLGLMLFTFTNERVVGSVLPFLLVLTALGLVRLWERFPRLRHGHGPILAGLLVLTCVSVPWAPGAWRTLSGRGGPPPDREAARLALTLAGHGARVATNNPTLSFYVQDPVLFGPSGRYRPLRRDPPCDDLIGAVRCRRATVAVLDHRGKAAEVWAADERCRPALVTTLDSPYGERHLHFFAIP